MDASHWFLLICLALNLYCCGSSWLIQVANYPLFSSVAASDFIRYHQEHTRRIGPVMILPAFVANLASLVFVVGRPGSIPLWAALVNGVLALIILVVTVRVEIPKHSQLDKEGQSEPLIHSLVRDNWPRTLAFTGQGLLMLWMVSVAFSAI